MSEELQYLELCKNVIENGNDRIDRTLVGTKSIFGATMKFSLRDETFPLITTKKMALKSIIYELLWFIKGNTNGKELKSKKVYIWKGHGSREYLDSIGLNNREIDDLGPIYGFQWRHYGEKYVDASFQNYKGIDQLQNVIDLIKNDPSSRRIILSSWNPTDIPLMALPPCHLLAQFYVNNGELSCQMYQRSADLGLGVPFNIASYSLLTIMIAHITNLKCGDFIHVIGDAHVYSNHIDALSEQIIRKPYPFPKISINRKVDSIDDFTIDDFTIDDYSYHDTINMDMAI
jgi:thymidylate synthase